MLNKQFKDLIWKIEFDSDVEKDLRKLGHTAKKTFQPILNPSKKLSPIWGPLKFRLVAQKNNYFKVCYR